MPVMNGYITEYCLILELYRNYLNAINLFVKHCRCTMFTMERYIKF